MDIVPTLLAAVGQPVPRELDGVDGLPMLQDHSASIRDHCVVEYVGAPLTTSVKTIVTENRKLTWYRQQDYGELYDLAKDPWEKINRWDDSACASDKSRLLCRILDNADVLEPRPRRISPGA